jgi:hypothetical protein
MEKETQTLLAALGLIVAASVAIAIGSHFGWHDLVTFALTFGGAGVGILTSQYSGHRSQGDGGAAP